MMEGLRSYIGPLPEELEPLGRPKAGARDL